MAWHPFLLSVLHPASVLQREPAEQKALFGVMFLQLKFMVPLRQPLNRTETIYLTICRVKL